MHDGVGGTGGGIVRITMGEARQLRQAWAARGNPPCDHPATAKEISDVVSAAYGWDTGDDVCLVCGMDGPRGWWRERGR
jgi:hypothetical protein